MLDLAIDSIESGELTPSQAIGEYELMSHEVQEILTTYGDYLQYEE